MDQEQEKDLKVTQELVNYVDAYYRSVTKESSIGGVTFAYYKSLRGYFKHSILLTDIKRQEFGFIDYKLWEEILTRVRSGKNPVESGGIFLKYPDFKGVCSESAFYKSRNKFLKLKLLIETPFFNYFILNPTYIIKVYIPEPKPKDKKKNPKK
jgi:hypothetical protein